MKSDNLLKEDSIGSRHNKTTIDFNPLLRRKGRGIKNQRNKIMERRNLWNRMKKRKDFLVRPFLTPGCFLVALVLSVTFLALAGDTVTGKTKSFFGY